MKKQNIIIILVFCAVILSLGAAVWLTPDREFSENENRYLQKLPVPNADIDTMITGGLTKLYLQASSLSAEPVVLSFPTSVSTQRFGVGSNIHFGWASADAVAVPEPA